jgi:putative SOS response-associated peptidase YedK
LPTCQILPLSGRLCCMCGRYTITTPNEELASYFGILPAKDAFEPTDDARPTANLPLVLQDNPHQMVVGHWGYPIRLGGKDKELINVRAESIMSKPFFRRAANEHRCMILADGYFEWRREGEAKKKFRFTLERQPMAFAGIYQWQAKKLSKEILPFYSIITAEATGEAATIHSRMPLILQPGHEKSWLIETFNEKLLAPFEGTLMIRPTA